jgi:hypothetical protein
VQNKPNLVRLRRIQNPLFDKGLRKKGQIFPPKSKPKQTQTKPIRPPFFARYGPPKQKQTQTNPKQTQSVLEAATLEASWIQRYYGQSRVFQSTGVLLIELDGKFRRELRCSQV